MPKFLEQALEKEAAKKGFTGRAAARYIYGALNNMGAMHGSKITPKGEAMQEKHNADQVSGQRKAFAAIAGGRHR